MYQYLDLYNVYNKPSPEPLLRLQYLQSRIFVTFGFNLEKYEKTASVNHMLYKNSIP